MRGSSRKRKEREEKMVKRLRVLGVKKNEELTTKKVTQGVISMNQNNFTGGGSHKRKDSINNDELTVEDNYDEDDENDRSRKKSKKAGSIKK